MRYALPLAIACIFALLSTTVTAQQRGDRHNRNYSTLKQLPRNHYRGVYAGSPYFVWGGRFYRNRGGVYVGISAPIGAIVPSLPGGFITIGTGPGRLFFYNDVFYRPSSRGYVVVEAPAQPLPAALPSAADTGRIIVYPKAGQSKEQTGRDRYDCHLWAEAETGFDPTMSDSDESLRNDYNRANSACLEARDYVVK